MDAANRAEHERTPLLLEWPCCVFVPVATERALLPILLRALQERGMMSSHPAWRMREIEGACARLGVSLETALSLRRHHIQLRQRGVPGSLLALGSDAEIKAQASAFERAIATYLDARGVSYVDEAAHAAHNLETYGRSRPTPDFWLTTPITLRIFGSGEADSRPLHWIEAKHFYAADSVSTFERRRQVGGREGAADGRKVRRPLRARRDRVCVRVRRGAGGGDRGARRDRARRDAARHARRPGARGAHAVMHAVM